MIHADSPLVASTADFDDNRLISTYSNSENEISNAAVSSHQDTGL